MGAKPPRPRPGEFPRTPWGWSFGRLSLVLFLEEVWAVAATDVRPKITLACEECKHRNYITKKNRRNHPDRLEIKKFCPNCGTHRAHKETR